MEKKCTLCSKNRPITSFYFYKKKNEYKDICTSCEQKEYRVSNRKKANKYAEEYRIKKAQDIALKRENRKEEANHYAKKYRVENNRKVSEYQKEYRIRNAEKSKSYRDKNKDKAKEYRLKNKERLREVGKKYRIKNRDKIKKANAKRRVENPLAKLSLNIRNLIKNSFLKNNHRKAKKTVQILGCTVVEFKKYIESKWENWMSWDNYGRYNPNRKTWQLDHIVPIASAKNELDLIKLNHYTNFQPLLSFDNLMKSDKINLF